MQRTVDAAIADAGCAAAEFDDAGRWLAAAVERPLDPFAAEVWVTDPGFGHVLLVRHRWRGWVPPGGRVDWGETPREAAIRELFEETGIRAELHPVPAAVSVRSYRADWLPTLGLSYTAVVDRSTPLAAESGQPADWLSLDRHWDGMFPEDRDRIRDRVRGLAEGLG
ncbi:NUDIX hydrolase [Actinospica durhamensis]|uniref:NUDIX hydrolase n=1 Tax=Actinospica durhamensis TaxID=1508375 RepID=A0A941EPA8_9ACTN|nr:NUDIX hydrolase [Actinospica durhamensis]MBR7834097.1 NUDIX hydrolase [Actinospica durhamensis]